MRGVALAAAGRALLCPPPPSSPQNLRHYISTCRPPARQLLTSSWTLHQPFLGVPLDRRTRFYLGFSHQSLRCLARALCTSYPRRNQQRDPPWLSAKTGQPIIHFTRSSGALDNISTTRLDDAYSPTAFPSPQTTCPASKTGRYSAERGDTPHSLLPWLSASPLAK